jgi:hypothetical protein
VIKGRSEDKGATMLINKALLCKIFRCLPSELDKEDALEIDICQFVYSIVGEKNPFMLM